MQLNNEKLELIRQDKYEWSDEEVVEVYYSFYSKEDEEKYNVVAFQLELL